MELMEIGLLGLLAEGSGLAIGILLLYWFKIKDKRLMGMLFGATSGLLLALICFDVLPEALSKGRMDLVLIGNIIGVLIGILLDDFVPVLQHKLGRADNSMSKLGLILALGLALHNFPEGFALGAMGQASMSTIAQFTFVLALHSIPEGLALAIPFKQGGTPVGWMLILSLLLGMVMGLGAIFGFVLSGLSESLVATGLGLASGLILYIVCQELLPESKKFWNGRTTTVATILGLLIGLVLLR